MREKLLQIGLSYDLAHAKGRFKETEEEREKREKLEWEAEKQRLKDEIRTKNRKQWTQHRRVRARQKKHQKKQEERERMKAEASHMAELRAPQQEKAVETFDSEGGKATNGGSEAGELTPTDILGAGHSPDPNGAVADITNAKPEDHIKRFNQDLDREWRRDRETIPHLQINGCDAVPNGVLEPPDSESELSFISDVDSEELPPPYRTSHHRRAKVLDDKESEDEYDEVEHDPWNAVCVVGLRVYSKDPDLSIEIVSPKMDNDAEAPLDLDDPAAGATKNSKSPEGSVKGSSRVDH